MTIEEGGIEDSDRSFHGGRRRGDAGNGESFGTERELQTLMPLWCSMTIFRNMCMRGGKLQPTFINRN